MAGAFRVGHRECLPISVGTKEIAASSGTARCSRGSIKDSHATFCFRPTFILSEETDANACVATRPYPIRVSQGAGDNAQVVTRSGGVLKRCARDIGMSRLSLCWSGFHCLEGGLWSSRKRKADGKNRASRLSVGLRFPSVSGVDIPPAKSMHSRSQPF